MRKKSKRLPRATEGGRKEGSITGNVKIEFLEKLERSVWAGMWCGGVGL